VSVPELAFYKNNEIMFTFFMYYALSSASTKTDKSTNHKPDFVYLIVYYK